MKPAHAEDYEYWVTVKGRRHGKPYAHRHAVQVPLDLVLGHLEKLSDLELRWTIRDLEVEQERRQKKQPSTLMGDWNPDNALFRGDNDA